jgi:hypothetical protein
MLYFSLLPEFYLGVAKKPCCSSRSLVASTSKTTSAHLEWQPTLRDDGNVKVKVEKVEVKLEDAGLVSRWSTGMRMTVTIAMPFSTCLRSAVDRLICRRSPRENQKGGFLLCMDTQVPLRLYLEG